MAVVDLAAQAAEQRARVLIGRAARARRCIELAHDALAAGLGRAAHELVEAAEMVPSPAAVL